MDRDILNISLKGATAGSALSTKCEKRSSFECPNPFSLTCIQHNRVIYVRCRRWRSCVACSAWKQWTLRQRLIAGS
jgi:hypothetical protein